MDVLLYGTLFGLGLFGGLLSGLLGIGGGIIMVPLLLYVPPALGLAPIGMKVVAGMTSLQSFVGAVSGAVGHNRYNRINPGLAVWLGGSMALASLIGSLASPHISENVMLLVFAGMALAAAIMMLMPKPKAANESEPQDAREVEYNKPLAVVIGLVIGTMSGIIGQGGAFLFIPAMLYLLHLPTRIVIGTALAVGILSSLAVLAGRIGTNQIPWAWTLVLVAGVVIGAWFGSHWSQKTPQRMLKQILALIICGTVIKIWWEVLQDWS